MRQCDDPASGTSCGHETMRQCDDVMMNLLQCINTSIYSQFNTFCRVNKHDVIQTISSHKAVLKSLGANEVCLFGSFLIDEAKSDSDVDLLVTINEVNYRQLLQLQLFLENSLQRKVDLIRKGPHVSNSFLSSIQSETIYA
jgi:predicted nucleotidyltransferase